MTGVLTFLNEDCEKRSKKSKKYVDKGEERC